MGLRGGRFGNSRGATVFTSVVGGKMKPSGFCIQARAVQQADHCEAVIATVTTEVCRDRHYTVTAEAKGARGLKNVFRRLIYRS